MNLAINSTLKLFSLSVSCSAPLFSALKLSLDTDRDDIENAYDMDDDGDKFVGSRDAFPL